MALDRRWQRRCPEPSATMIRRLGATAFGRALRRSVPGGNYAGSVTVAAIFRFMHWTVPLPHPTIFATLRMP
jgi:hypothetical protein